MGTEETTFNNIANYFSLAIFESMKLFIMEELAEWQLSIIRNMPIVWIDFEVPDVNKFGRTSIDLLTNAPERIELNNIVFKKMFHPHKKVVEPIFFTQTDESHFT